MPPFFLLQRDPEGHLWNIGTCDPRSTAGEGGPI